MANEIRLDILGTSFNVTADEDEAYLSKVLAQYKAAVKNTQKISGITEPLNVAILTGFILCDEFNKIKKLLEERGETSKDDSMEAEEVEDRTIRLIAKLEQALNLYTNEK
ncbi:MAG: cell division protein ZapA [Treponema sp.]|nr:cell division protein ZapA [Treponema sp.]MCL2238090.1 cell division protein ZapA [Treponema sp.]